MISLSNIKKVVHQNNIHTPILHSINLEINQGDFISIMGPSGSGKSTLLNIIGLLDHSTSGDYYYKGLNVNKMNSRKLSTLRSKEFGFVFQAFMLIPRLTVKQNVELPLLYTSLGKKKRMQRVEEALRQVGLLDKINEPVIKLSGGQKQKTAIARAIVNNPDIILADEPTGNLDQQSKDDVLQIFKSLNEQKKTLIIVTHDPEVSDIAKTKLVMKNGSWIDLPHNKEV